MIDDAIKIIKAGGIIAFPTETVYGLGCDATCADAVNRIYALKNRDQKPLSIIVKNIETAQKYAVFNETELKLASQYWPGSLTLVLDKKPSSLAQNVTTTDKIGIRIPNHPIALDLLNKIDVPLVATSVNFSGKPPMDYDEIIKNFKNDIDLIIPNPQNIPSGKSSTVIRVENDNVLILRQGDVVI